MIIGLPIVKAQEKHTAQEFIGYAQNETYNFGFYAKQYWFNLSQQVLFQSFSDIQGARDLISIAQSYIGKNDTLAVLYASEAAYEAKNANYRLFVYLTASVLRDANQTVYGIPSYIPKPTDAVDNLNKAIQLNQTYSTIYQGLSNDPERTWLALQEMENSIEQLWGNQDSAANLARLAKKEALDYLAQQMPIAQKEMNGEFGSLHFRSLMVAIPLVLSLIVALPTFIALRRRFLGWIGNITNLKWSGYLFQRRIMGPLLIGSVVSLTVAAESLILILSELHDKILFYQLELPRNLQLIEMLTYSVLLIAILVVILVILNGAITRGRIFTGIAALLALAVAFALTFCVWGITLIFLLY
jgi:hypothetical protein